jgi:hypothetical protein
LTAFHHQLYQEHYLQKNSSNNGINFSRLTRYGFLSAALLLAATCSLASPARAQIADSIPGLSNLLPLTPAPKAEPKPDLGNTPTQSRAGAMAGSVGQSVAPGSSSGETSSDSAPVSGLVHPYRMIVRSSLPLVRAEVTQQLGDSKVKIYALNFGSAEVREYVLSVETTLAKEEVLSRLKKVPGVTLVSEDGLMRPN